MNARATTVRVLIVSDHPLLLAGLQAVLDDDNLVAVVGMASTAAEALEVAHAEDPDVIFFDVRLAANSGFDLITEMRHTHLLTEFVALAGSDDAETFRDAMHRGVHGYLLDNASRENICLAVKRVGAGKSHIDPAVSGHLMQPYRGDPIHDGEALTPREVAVLKLAAQGLTNNAIAAQLGLKTETIKTHLSRAFERLGARDRANAVAICMRHGVF
jgi:DNA-binding NarL/FixJ family response regulator